jgi:diaminohydroxyphosphoribosylaminopyrimidine deaminase/5-amino-6-(5-phosphoribosylamino)uracil reductase
MRGRGLDLLRQGGVDVSLGISPEACSRLMLGFTRAVTVGLPEVTCKAAISLDGHLATASGESRWITGEEARAHGHRLRAEHDAILIGIGTALADDPMLTCRVEGGRNPVPVVLDTRLQIPEDSAIFRHPRKPLIVCGKDAPQRDLPASIARVDLDQEGEHLDIRAALRVLVEHGIHRVLVEGGGRVHRTLLGSGLVDTLCVYVAGVLLPGGRPWLGGPALASLAEARRFGAPDVERLGRDVLLRYALGDHGEG